MANPMPRVADQHITISGLFGGLLLHLVCLVFSILFAFCLFVLMYFFVIFFFLKKKEKAHKAVWIERWVGPGRRWRRGKYDQNILYKKF